MKCYLISGLFQTSEENLTSHRASVMLARNEDEVVGYLANEYRSEYPDGRMLSWTVHEITADELQACLNGVSTPEDPE